MFKSIRPLATHPRTLLVLGAVTAVAAIGAFNGGTAVSQGPFAIPIATLTQYAPSIGIYGAITSIIMAAWSFAHGRGLSTIGVPIIVLMLSELGIPFISTLSTSVRDPLSTATHANSAAAPSNALITARQTFVTSSAVSEPAKR